MGRGAVAVVKVQVVGAGRAVPRPSSARRCPPAPCRRSAGSSADAGRRVTFFAALSTLALRPGRRRRRGPRLKSSAWTVAGRAAVEGHLQLAVAVHAAVSPSAGSVALTSGARRPVQQMPAAGVDGRAPMSVEDVDRRLLDPAVGVALVVEVPAKPRHQWLVPLANTQAPLAAGRSWRWPWRCRSPVKRPFSCTRPPDTGDAATVATPAGSLPLFTRASHSQPTMSWPDVWPPAGAAARPARCDARRGSGPAPPTPGAGSTAGVVADVHLADELVLGSVRSGRVAPGGSGHAARVGSGHPPRSCRRP